MDPGIETRSLTHRVTPPTNDTISQPTHTHPHIAHPHLSTPPSLVHTLRSLDTARLPPRLTAPTEVGQRAPNLSTWSRLRAPRVLFPVRHAAALNTPHTCAHSNPLSAELNSRARWETMTAAKTGLYAVPRSIPMPCTRSGHSLSQGASLHRARALSRVDAVWELNRATSPPLSTKPSTDPIRKTNISHAVLAERRGPNRRTSRPARPSENPSGEQNLSSPKLQTRLSPNI